MSSLIFKTVFLCSSLVIEFLKRGVKPDHENDEKMTFIDSSPIKARLWQKIETSPDEWCHATFKVWKKDGKVLECWINLGDDDILSGIFWRMIEYFFSFGLKKSFFHKLVPILSEEMKEA